MRKLLYLNPEPEPKPITALSRLPDSLAVWFAGVRNPMAITAAEAREDDSTWQTVESVMAALRWFDSAAPARAILAQLTTGEES